MADLFAWLISFFLLIALLVLVMYQDDLHIIGLVTAVLACIMECCKLPDVCGREQLVDHYDLIKN
ncbi:hypothetical protein JHK85_002529 [Glycine max]|nr:hypothetical protein JHK85_002529 [Glycine max]